MTFVMYVCLNKIWDVQEVGIITEADLLWVLVIHMGKNVVEGKKIKKKSPKRRKLDAEGIISKSVKAWEVKTFYWGAVKIKDLCAAFCIKLSLFLSSKEA